MAIQTREKEIEGAVYTVTQLTARRALRLKAKLIKMLGPVVAQIFITASEKSADIEKKDNIVKAIELLGGNLDEISFENIIVELLQGVRKDGVELQPAIIDLEFAGDLVTLYKVIWFVLEANYGSFFTMLGIGSEFPESHPAQAGTKKTFMRT